MKSDRKYVGKMDQNLLMGGLKCVSLGITGWIEALTPNATDFGDGAFNEVIKVKWGHRVDPNPMASVFIRRGRDTRHDRAKAMWRHSEKGAICKPKREGSGETKLADTLILDFQSPELGENIFLLCEPLSLWYFVMAALAN